MVTAITSGRPLLPGTDAEARRIGDLLVQAGVLTEGDVIRIVGLQRQQKLLFGEAALKLGLLHEDDIRSALALQYKYSWYQDHKPGVNPALFVADQPFDAQAEAVRTLRSQLTMRWLDERRRALAVVAPRSGQGASVLAANLAIAFAQLGESTLLIDADMRSPQQHRLFGLNRRNGLAGILANRTGLQEALTQVVPFNHLSVLCAGIPVPNPQELLYRSSFAYLINAVSNSFDVVIIDAPAILEYADAQIIGATCGGCVIAARRHVTRMADVEAAQAQLAPCNVKVIGAVVHELPMTARKSRGRRDEYLE